MASLAEGDKNNSNNNNNIDEHELYMKWIKQFDGETEFHSINKILTDADAWAKNPFRRGGGGEEPAK